MYRPTNIHKCNQTSCRFRHALYFCVLYLHVLHAPCVYTHKRTYNVLFTQSHRKRIHKDTHMHIHARVHTHTHTHTHMHTHTHKHTHRHTNAKDTDSRTHWHIGTQNRHIHVHKHTQTHKLSHTHIYTRAPTHPPARWGCRQKTTWLALAQCRWLQQHPQNTGFFSKVSCVAILFGKFSGQLIFANFYLPRVAWGPELLN